MAETGLAVDAGILGDTQPAVSTDTDERIKTRFLMGELLIQSDVLKPIEVRVVRAGLTVAAGIHGDVRSDKAASNGCAENATIHIFSNRPPLTRLIREVEVIGLFVSLYFEIQLSSANGLFG